MPKKIILCIFAVAAFAFLTSCGGGGRQAVFTEGDTLYIPRYATGFVVLEVPGGKLLRISDPWQGAEGFTQELFLASGEARAPRGFDGITLPVPLTNVVCMSSTYIAYISELGRTGAVTGVSGAKYVSNEGIRAGYAAGRVRDVGYDANMNYEMLAALSPDVVFAYGVTGENTVLSGKLAQLGVDMVYIGDYVEQSPLGKAEWLVAFGYMFGEEELAKAIFMGVEDRYNMTKAYVLNLISGGCQGDPDWQITDPIGFRIDPAVTDEWGGLVSGGEIMDTLYAPVVMLNAPYRDTWFVPGDRSYMARLIEDAGGLYACAGEDSETSRPISIETAYVKMLSADVWLNPGQAGTIAEVKAENPRLATTRPVVNGQVYNCNKRSTPEGGSDFWESGAVRPDVVLKDLATIFYPWLFDNKELYYFQGLE